MHCLQISFGIWFYIITIIKGSVAEVQLEKSPKGGCKFELAGEVLKSWKIYAISPSHRGRKGCLSLYTLHGATRLWIPMCYKFLLLIFACILSINDLDLKLLMDELMYKKMIVSKWMKRGSRSNGYAQVIVNIKEEMTAWSCGSLEVLLLQNKLPQT